MESNGSNGYSLKEMMTTLLDRVEAGFARIEVKIDELKSEKADRLDVDALKVRVAALEIKQAKEEGAAAFKRWVFPVVVSTVVALVSAWILVHYGTPTVVIK